MLKNNYIGFDDRYLLLLGIPLVSFLFPIFILGVDLSIGLVAYLPIWFNSIIYASCYWLSARAVFIQVRKRYPHFRDTTKRLIISTFLVLIVYFLVSYFLIFLAPCLSQIGFHHHEKFSTINSSSFLLIAFFSAVYEGVYYYVQLKQAIEEKEALKRENIQSKLEGLKAQVNPHFLFNSLNTLAYIIPEEPEKAVKFVHQLSKVYRYILDIREHQLISLEAELEFLKAYIFLLKQRFEENLYVDIAIPDTLLNQQIIPLSLQLLLENAIKHNIISDAKPLTIDVFIEKDKLVVKNNLQRKKQVTTGTKLGLENIKKRYRFLAEEEVEILETEAHFVVKLPFINTNFS